MKISFRYIYQLFNFENVSKLPNLLKNRGIKWVFTRVAHNHRYFRVMNIPVDNNKLEERYPGITKPTGIETLAMLDLKFAPLNYEVIDRPKYINFFFPQLDPLIMFGGYASYINLMVRLDLLGYKIRALICEDNNKFSRCDLLKKYSRGKAKTLFENLEVINITQNNEAVDISKDDEFISYSAWTSYTAHQLAKAVGKKFYFFIQEDESIFHCQDSLQVLVNGAYDLEHYAIFNSEMLKSHFKDNKKGVFKYRNGEENSISFEHALTKTITPTISELRSRKVNRVLLYLRPEDHAKRNLFEIAILALKEAERRGAFEQGSWEFIGVGTLGPCYEIPISKKHSLSIISKMPADDYAKALTEFDLGISLMNAPHPSLLPFEMASSGILTVTNTYSNRTHQQLKSISGNIYPAEMNIDSIADQILSAINDIPSFEQRLSNADIKWSNDWSESFNDEFLSKITASWT